jgi:hypothetical protein
MLHGERPDSMEPIAREQRWDRSTQNHERVCCRALETRTDASSR